MWATIVNFFKTAWATLVSSRGNDEHTSTSTRRNSAATDVTFIGKDFDQDCQKSSKSPDQTTLESKTPKHKKSDIPLDYYPNNLTTFQALAASRM